MSESGLRGHQSHGQSLEGEPEMAEALTEGQVIQVCGPQCMRS